MVKLILHCKIAYHLYGVQWVTRQHHTYSSKSSSKEAFDWTWFSHCSRFPAMLSLFQSSDLSWLLTPNAVSEWQIKKSRSRLLPQGGARINLLESAAICRLKLCNHTTHILVPQFNCENDGKLKIAANQNLLFYFVIQNFGISQKSARVVPSKMAEGGSRDCEKQKNEIGELLKTSLVKGETW